MSVIKVVADSGADIPRHFVEDLDITVVPLSVNFEEERLRDGVDLQPSQFYRRLADGAMPSTTQPSPADFEAAYSSVAAEADVIISCHLSGALSGTMQSATIAANEFDIPIHVLDTRSASLGQGIVAIEAARLAKAGRPVEEILERAHQIIEHQRVLFMVDTLEYLQRNGRIGRAQAFVGSMLNIKPVLTLEDGIVTPLERARGRRAAIERLLVHMERNRSDKPFRLGIMHANVPQEAAALRDQILTRFTVEELTVTELGPTIGTHIGPGAMGVVYYTIS